jgi:N-acetylneuraminic acid mutarotase
MFLMYGGRDETKIYCDLWLYHIERNEWEEIQISPGLGMTPRFGHTSVMHNYKMLIFGGWDGNQTLSDILEYNLASNQWD